MKSEKVPEVFFKKEIPPLVLTEKCEKLQLNTTYIWLLELINLYQSMDHINQHVYQIWIFKKQEDEILVICRDAHGNLIHYMVADIGSHHQSFSDITLCIFEGKCMAEDECEIAMKRDSA